MICRTLKALTVAMAALIAVGCASQPKSQAYLLNESLGGHRIEDKVSNEEHQKSSPLLKHGILIAGANYQSTTGLGLTNFRYEGLATSLITAMLDIGIPKTYEKTWIVGRLPMTAGESAEDLHRRIFDDYLQAARTMLDESGLEYSVYEHDSKTKRGPGVDADEMYEFEVFIINAPEYKCEYMVTDAGKKDSNCALLVRAGGLKTDYAPQGHELAGQESWRISSSLRHEIKFVLNDEGFLPVMEMHQRVSELLPHWAYMFMPDSDAYPVLNASGEAKGYPYFLNQGKELHFVNPEASR